MKQIFFLIILFTTITSSAQTPFMEDVEGIAVGDTITTFSGITQDSSTYLFVSDSNDRPTVVIFIRGYWCGYCNKHMSHLQDSFSQISATGANILIVSPEKPSFLKKTAEKNKTEFTLLYDSAYAIMQQFDVLWAPKEKDLKKYMKYFGNEMRESHSDQTQRLPVPATYILDKNGIITWRHFDRDYSKRSTVKDILKHLGE